MIRGRTRRRRIALVGLCAFVLTTIGCAPARTTTSESSTTAPGSGTCHLNTLPPEVDDTVRLIHSGGPFPYPRNDGVVFGNREGHLPKQVTGYYHEYTVITPRASNRSTRRIITGGAPLTNPPQYFYTNDHYDSFCLVADAGTKR